MKAIIIGAGKVGFSIAKILSQEGHDVVVIDTIEERIDIIEEQLDVQTIQGSGTNSDILVAAGVMQADLLAAVTERDELNMIACQIAKSYGAKITVARVRNPEYAELDETIQKKNMGIDLIINPEMVMADEIHKLIDFSEAQSVEYYADNRVQIVELKINEGDSSAGMMLRDFNFSKPFLVVAILRNGKLIIPRGYERIKVNDMIFVLADVKDMEEIERFFGKKRNKIKDCIILGAGRVGFYLAKLLEKKHVHVKLIDNDLKKCKEVAQELHETLVIHGDGTDLQLLEDESVGGSDLLVAAMSDDKLNILASLLAKDLGVKKTVTRIGRSDYIHLLEKIGIDQPISPRMLTAGEILKFVRRGEIISVTMISDSRAQINEMLVTDRYKHINKPLSAIRFPEGAILGALVRDEEVVIPTGSDEILVGDRMIVFSLPEAVSKVESFFLRS